MTPPPDDILLAARRGLRFRVCKKERPPRQGRWRTVHRDVDALETALALAVELAPSAEAAVFVDGFTYWTSATPDLFNSTVLKLAPG